MREAEAQRRGGVRPTTTRGQEAQMSGVYRQLKPTDLQGYSYPTE